MKIVRSYTMGLMFWFYVGAFPWVFSFAAMKAFWLQQHRNVK